MITYSFPQIIAGDEILDERQMYNTLDRDLYMSDLKAALQDILAKLHKLFPKAVILGHRDLPGVRKACPCFNVTKTYVFRC